VSSLIEYNPSPHTNTNTSQYVSKILYVVSLGVTSQPSAQVIVELAQAVLERTLSICHHQIPLVISAEVPHQQSITYLPDN